MNQNRYIENLKKILKRHDGNNEVIHIQYDDILREIIVNELKDGRELIDKLEALLEDVSFWYA